MNALIIALIASLSLFAGNQDHWHESDKPDVEHNDQWEDLKPEDEEWPDQKPDDETEEDWIEEKPDQDLDDSWEPKPEDKPEIDEEWPEDHGKPDQDEGKPDQGDVEQMPGRSGCWVKMYDKEDLRGEPYIFYGNISVRSMDDDVIRQATGGRIQDDLENEIDSLKVGPRAILTVFDDTDFEDDHNTFHSGFVAHDLDEYPVGHNFESFKIRCRR